jgi:hypothetical protein
MKELFDKFQKAVDGLNRAVEGDQKEETQEPEAQEMTPEQFLNYAIDQVNKAADDTPEVRVLRLKSLQEYVELAKAEYSFEGKSNKLTGILSVTQYRDPGQVQTTEKTQAPAKIKEGQTNYADVAIQPAVNGAGSPTGQKMPPLSAGGSGFETPGNASFAKAFEKLDELLSSLTKEEPKKEDTKKAEPKEDKKVETKKSEDVPETSQDDTFWPFDMNSPFGRGETKNPEVPEWGRDGQEIPDETVAES